LKISIPPSEAMETLNVVDSSQAKVPIIAPSQIGIPLNRSSAPLIQSSAQTSQPAQWRSPASQEQLAELRAKCAPYMNTKIEDVETKRIALPPHECAEVLSWMRDSRMERLYGSEKPAR